MTKEDYLSELTEARRQARAKFGHLDADLLNRKPSPESWSAAQCLDHLVRTGSKYREKLESLLENPDRKTIWMRIPFWSDLCARLVIKAVHPDTKRKIKTFPVFQPSRSSVPGSIVADFEEFIDGFKEVTAKLCDRQLLDHKVSSPVSDKFCFRVSELLMIVILHNFRHIKQAELALRQ